MAAVARPSPGPLADSGRSSDWAFKRLFQLESECRSATPAVQVEAIGEFPKLLDQFPFPMLVSSAFLKLGDLFRGSANSLRHHIAQVFETSQHHLAQITHTDELLKRILAVLYSNDPIARVLALRLIGNASSVFARFPEAQHGTLLRYQSSHPLEIAAAVQTTERMLEFWPGFLDVVWDTAWSKADKAQVSDPVRVQLIRSLRHAASSLQLSAQLYPRCRSWVERPDSTAVVQCAALDTWRSIIQPHNELTTGDAKFVSRSIAHGLASVRRAALALLNRWRPTSGDIRLAAIGCLLCSHLSAQLGEDAMGDLGDLGEIRLATITLARIEAACSPTGTPQSWAFAMSLNAKAFRSFNDARRTGNAAARLSYRLLVSSVMVQVNAATILGTDSTKSSTACTIRDAWLALAEECEGADDAAYLRRFLRVSWAWCKSMGVESTVAEALPALLDARSCSVACAAAALASLPRFYSHVAAKCDQQVDGLASAPGNAGGCTTAAAWNSILAMLARGRRLGAAAPSDMGNGPADVAVAAVSRWAGNIYEHASSPAECASAFGASGPPVWAVRPTLVLLAVGGHWGALGQLCQALLACGIGGWLQDQLYALSALATAEASATDTAAFLRSADIALNTLHALHDQGSRCAYRLALVQLRRELVCLRSEWDQLRAPPVCGPAAAYLARSLTDRTGALAVQADLVHNVYPSADRASREWLACVRESLRCALQSLDASTAPADRSGCPDVQRAAALALAGIECAAATFNPGPALLAEPPIPSICFEARPNLGGNESTLAVLAGSQLHFVVEGFVRWPRGLRSAAHTRVRVAVWLSWRPRSASGQDLRMRAEYYAVAQQSRGCALNSAVPDTARSNENSGADTDTGTIATSPATAFEATVFEATVFEAPLDGAFFKCPCTATTPSLRAMLGHAEANATCYVHIFCGLVDTAGHAWWIGPHTSHPLLVSTTARS